MGQPTSDAKPPTWVIARGEDEAIVDDIWNRSTQNLQAGEGGRFLIIRG